MHTIEYRIQSGDTLSSIARRHSITVEELSQLNGLSDVNRLWAGKLLQIPAKPQSLPPPPTKEPLKYRVRAGDTLSKIASRNHVTVDVLVQANALPNPDRIGVGQMLSIPREAPPKPTPKVPSMPPSRPQTPLPVSKADAATVRNGPAQATKPPPLSLEMKGVPLYQQDDKRWGSHKLGSTLDIANYGCAMTAAAMAITKLSGRPMTPGQLDEYLDKHGGYSGDSLLWDTAAAARGLSATWPFPPWNLKTIDKELAAGRPVVVGVNTKEGSGGGRWGTNHWVTLTGKGMEKGKTVYSAHDPANGKRFLFTVNEQKLETTPAMGAAASYSTTGELRTFCRGRNTATSSAARERAGHFVALGGTEPQKKASYIEAPSLDSVRSGKGTLSSRMKGPAVREVQRLLVRIGLLSQKKMNSGPGLFGPATRAAVTEFQKRNRSLPVGSTRGTVDQRTLEALCRASASNGQNTQTSSLGLLAAPDWQKSMSWSTPSFLDQRPIWERSLPFTTASTTTPPKSMQKALAAGSSVMTSVKAKTPAPQENDSWFGSILDWLWGTIQGDFNSNPTTGQNVVNMVLGLIPGLDQLLDVRDIVAGLKDIIEYYMEDEAEQQAHPTLLSLPHEFWLWVNVFIIAIGCIPVVGSAAKGVLKMFISFLQNLGKKADVLTTGQIKALVKSFGLQEAEAFKYLKTLSSSLNDWMGKAFNQLKSVLESLKSVLIKAEEYAKSDLIQYPAKWAGKEKELKQFIAGVGNIKRALQKSYDRLDAMKAQVNQWLGEQVGKLAQPQQVPTKNVPSKVKADPASVNTRAGGQTQAPKTRETSGQQKTPVAKGTSGKQGRTTNQPRSSQQPTTVVDSKKTDRKSSSQTITNQPMDDAKLEELLNSLPNWQGIEQFVGRRIPKPDSPEFKVFKTEVEKAGYVLHVKKEGTQQFRLHRKSGNAQAQLTMLDGNMVVLKVKGKTRLSVPSRCRNNYLNWVEETQGPAAREGLQKLLSEGHQLHHLIPDQIAQTNPLIQEALKRLDGYNIDRGMNILEMPSAKKVGEQIVHLGSHPEYTSLVETELSQALTELLEGGKKTLETIPPSEINSAILKVEETLREMIKTKDKRIPLKKTTVDGETADKLALLRSQREGEHFTA
jgi:LysM repeat protein/peptidoglycan hydrolase-like protein with peptidoglycan-binding domain